MKKTIDQEIDATLQSLDEIQHVTAPVFFYTRLMARMELKQATRSAGVFSRPVLSLATLAFLLVLNIGAIAHFMRSDKEPARQQEGLQSLVSEMSRDLSSVYNDKPIQ